MGDHPGIQKQEGEPEQAASHGQKDPHEPGGITQWAYLPPDVPAYYGLRERILEPISIYGFPVLLFLTLVGLPVLFFLLPSQGVDELSPADRARIEAPPRNESASAPLLSPDPPAATTRVRISTVPLGATVFLNADSVGVTPMSLFNIEAGTYSVAVRMAHYLPIDTVISLHADQFEPLFFFLDPAAPGDTPFLSQVESFDLPVPEQPAPTEGRSDVAQAVVQDDGGSLSTAARRDQQAQSRQAGRATRASSGEILITSEPSGATIWLDDELIGQTPLFLREVEVGRRRVVLRMEGYADFVTEVEVERGQTGTIIGQLTAVEGMLTVLVKPWGSIYIDDVLHKQDTNVRYRTRLKIGPHRVRVVHPVLGTVALGVQLRGDSPQDLEIDLNTLTNGQAGAAVAEEQRSPEQSPVRESAPAEPFGIVDEKGVYVVVDEPPEPIGGLEELHRKTRYPEKAYKFRVQGRVYLRFIVDAEGRVHEPEVTRGLSRECDQEALRVIKQTRFVPGIVGGRPVRAWHALFINFQIDE